MVVQQADKAIGRSSGDGLRYQEAMAFVERNVQVGKYHPGQKLPPMKTLCLELGMSFITLRRALIELEEKGVVKIKHGSGTFISDHLTARPKKTVRIALAFRSFMMDCEGTHPALGAYLVGAHRRCTPSECVLQSLFYAENRFTEDLGQAMLDEQINGVVVLADARLKEEDFQFLRNHHIHVVTMSHKAREDQWTISLMNDRLGSLSGAVEHLRSLGHQRIGLISYVHTRDDGNLHRHFARLAFEQRLGDPNELLTLVNDTAGVTHWQDVEQFFRITPLPTAVVVNDEFLADIILDGCERRGIKVPAQLSLLALQDARPLGHRIPLTAVQTEEDLSRLAATACDLLIKRIAGQPIPESHVVLRSKLVVKASTGPVASNGSTYAMGKV